MSDIKLIKHGVPVRFGKAGEEPASPENGMIFYDTSVDLFKVYENSAWQILSSRDYADSRAAGFDIKQSCRAASTANIASLSSMGSSLDGVSLANGDRVLIKDQTAAAQNGIYVYTSGSLARAADFDSSAEVTGGEFVFIREGAVFGNCAFVCTSSGPITIGSSAISFTQFSGSAKTLQQYYSVGGEISTSAGRNVVIAGSEKLDVSASGGVEISGALSAGATLLSSASVSNSMSIASDKLVISSAGNITKLNNVTTSFPTSASMSNYALSNNGSGSLSFSNLAVSNLNDVLLTSTSNQDLIQYNSTSGKWLNQAAISLRSSALITSSSVAIGDVSQDPPNNSAYEQLMASGSSRVVQIFDTLQAGYVDSVSLRIKRTSGSDNTAYLLLYEVTDVTYNSQRGRYTGTKFLDSYPLAISSNGVVPSSLGNSGTFQTVTWTFTNRPLLETGKKYAVLLNNSASRYVGDPWNSPDLKGALVGGGSGTAYTYAYNGDYYLPFWDNLRLLVSMSGETIPTGVLTTNASGYLTSSLVQYNVNLGNKIISGIASPSVSTDLANMAYVDSVSLQKLYDQDADGSGATITTNATDGDLIIAGTEKLQVTASSGLDISQLLSASGSLSAGSLIVGSGSMSVSATGDMSKIKGVSYAFPSAQASKANYILTNDGSGSLSWSNLGVSQLNDIALTSVSNGQILRFDGTKFVNESPVTSGVADRILMTNASGRVDSALLQYNVNFGNNKLSNVAQPLASQDASNMAYVDSKSFDSGAGTGSLTLQTLYDQDTNGSDATLATSSGKGDLDVSGSQSFVISAAKGMQLADSAAASRFSKVIYKHDMSLLADQTATALSDLSFSAALYEGCVIEYRIRDASGISRVGTLLVSSDGTNTSISDSFAEISPIGLSWSAAISGSDVEIRYTTNGSAKSMSAAIKLFLGAA